MNCIPILQHQHYNSVKTKFEGLNHSLLISVLKLPVCNKCTALWLISAHFYLFGFSVTLEDSVLRIHELNTFIQIRSAPVTFEYSAKAKTLSAKYTKIYFFKTPKTFFTQVLYCFRWILNSDFLCRQWYFLCWWIETDLYPFIPFYIC